MPIRVVLAEDSFIVREGVARLLESAGGLELVAACEDYDSLMAAVEKHRPDVVLTDIRMPPTGTDEGIRAAAEIRNRWPEIGVVVLSQHADAAYALSLFDGGSERRAYLLKERVADLDHLLAAIREVAGGGSVVDPKVVEGLVAMRSRKKESLLRHLTPRETEVLEQMAQGKNNHAIAEALVLSDRAIEKYINVIFQKLELSSEMDLHRRVKAVLVFLAEQGG
ncbi:MAG TPA: response regulator transcription factor [Actinomycetota bacterium]|nr:response regulator transcription factor [Actinomycetota bacterium]